MLALFIETVTRVTIPLMTLMGLGFVLQRRFSLDVASLGRVLVHCVVPCALIHFLTSTDLPLSAVSFTAGFTCVKFAVLLLLGRAVAWAVQIDPALRWVFAVGVAFPNSGNYGIPVIELVFGPDWILHQSVITSVQVVLVIICASLLLSGERVGLGGIFRMSVQTPLIPAVVIGLAVKGAGIPLPMIVSEPLRIMAGALTPLALFILGVQLASTNWMSAWKPVAALTLLRLAVAPVLTSFCLLFVAVPGTLSDVLIVGACAPIGVLLAIFVAEHEDQASLASAAVVVTTFLSPLVITLVISILGVTVYTH